jgi:hypothetical protein
VHEHITEDELGSRYNKIVEILNKYGDRDIIKMSKLEFRLQQLVFEGVDDDWARISFGKVAKTNDPDESDQCGDYRDIADNGFHFYYYDDTAFYDSDYDLFIIKDDGNVKFTDDFHDFMEVYPFVAEDFIKEIEKEYVKK